MNLEARSRALDWLDYMFSSGVCPGNVGLIQNQQDESSGGPVQLSKVYVPCNYFTV